MSKEFLWARSFVSEEFLCARIFCEQEFFHARANSDGQTRPRPHATTQEHKNYFSEKYQEKKGAKRRNRRDGEGRGKVVWGEGGKNEKRGFRVRGKMKKEGGKTVSLVEKASPQFPPKKGRHRRSSRDPTKKKTETNTTPQKKKYKKRTHNTQKKKQATPQVTKPKHQSARLGASYVVRDLFLVLSSCCVSLAVLSVYTAPPPAAATCVCVCAYIYRVCVCVYIYI